MLAIEKLGPGKLNDLLEVTYSLAEPPQCFLPTGLEGSKMELMGQSPDTTWLMEKYLILSSKKLL